VLTIFCSPKPFIGEAAWNQINALRSWKAISPHVEIIVFGAVPGAAEAAAQVNADLVPEVETSSTGAPSFNAMVQHASKYGKYNIQVYINCDILINATMVKAMQVGFDRFGRFLLVGERLDLEKGIKIDTRDPGWMDNLAPLAENGQLIPHGPTGVDYFGFPRDMWGDLPPVYMGRAMCDNALLHYCLGRHIPVLDATLAVVAIHQFHDYTHVQGGSQEVFAGEDRARMMKMHGLDHSLPTIADSSWMFVEKNALIPKKQHFLREIELRFRYRYGWHRIALVFRALQYVFARERVVPIKKM
jgi:hypothetical protein